jgi:hypothetical protein
MDYKVINRTQRPWGYEVRIKVLDNSDVKGCLTIQFPKEPSDKFLVKRCQQSVDHFELGLDNQLEVPDKMYTPEEITQILRTKGYLSAKEQFGDEMSMKELIRE